MAINPLPQGLHTQYTEVLDSSPFLRRNLENEAKRAAKEEALNQYFNELPNKINTAGVRGQDLDSPVGGINSDINSWRENWMQNSDAIKKGGMAQQQHLQKYQEILRKIEQSKNRAKTELELGKLKLEGKYDPDDDDIQVLSKIGKSIYDPTSYKPDGVSEYNIGDLSPAIPEFDADRQMKFWNSITKGATPGEKFNYDKAYTNKATNKVIVPFEVSFSEDQIQTIAKNAANAATEDRSARKYYNKVLSDQNTERWQELNKAYQSVFGDKEMVSTVEQAAAADAIIRAKQSAKTGEKPMENKEATNQFRIYMRESGGGSGGGDTDINDVYRGILTKARDNSSKGFTATRFNSLNNAEQDVVKTAVNKAGIDLKESGNNIFLFYDKDKDEVRVYRTTGGNLLPTPEKEITTLSFVGTNLSEQADVKAKRKVVAKGQEQPKSNEKPKKDPLGLGL